MSEEKARQSYRDYRVALIREKLFRLQHEVAVLLGEPPPVLPIRTHEEAYAHMMLKDEDRKEAAEYRQKMKRREEQKRRHPPLRRKQPIKPSRWSI